MERWRRAALRHSTSVVRYSDHVVSCVDGALILGVDLPDIACAAFNRASTALIPFLPVFPQSPVRAYAWRVFAVDLLSARKTPLTAYIF